MSALKRAAEHLAEAERALKKGQDAAWAQQLDEAIAAYVSAREYGAAAEVAERLKDPKRAARLWFRAGDFRRAAEHHRALDEPLEAADLFERAGELVKAAEIFEELGDLARAAGLFERAGEKQRSADLLMAMVAGHSPRGITLTSAERAAALARAGALYGEIGLVTEAVNALIQGGHLANAATILASAGRLREASDLMASSGDLLAAADLARMGGDERQALLLLAARAEAEGYLAEAAAYYEQAHDFAQAAIIHEFADDPSRAAEAHERARNFETAASLFQKLGRDHDAARCLRAGGKPEAADALLEHADERTIAAHRARGHFLAAAQELLKRARRGERALYEDARRCLASYPPTHPHYVTAQTLTAEILEEVGERQRAITILRTLLLATASPPVGADAHDALYLLGRLLEAEGFFADARAAYRRLWTSDPTYKDAERRLRHLTESTGAGLIPASGPTSSSSPSGALSHPITAPAFAPLLKVGDEPPANAPPPRGRHAGDASGSNRRDDDGRPDDEGSDALRLSVAEPRRLLSPEKEGEASGDVDGNIDGNIEGAADGDTDGGRREAGGRRDAYFMAGDEEDPIELTSEVRTHPGFVTESPFFQPPSLEGRVLRGRFKIEREVERTSTAFIYLARDTVLERRVAIKVLSPSAGASEEGMKRFLLEARLAARVHHPACLAIYDFGTERGLTFIAMEFVDARPLAEVLGEGPLPLRRALELARRAADVLAAAHLEGVFHQDIKPTTLLIDDAERLRLVDFGVAARASTTDREQDSFLGTPKYMSPEQANGDPIDGRSDLYTLGVVLFEMIAGRPPFEGTLAALAQRLTRPPPELPADIAVPERVRQILAHCLALKPAERFPTAAELVHALDDALASLGLSQDGASPSGPEIGANPDPG
ncbi:MAG: protein kinase [Deltaproteobacteria bacterium]|nr:protein kinase [Deltaproteobacteria bacterium]